MSSSPNQPTVIIRLSISDLTLRTVLAETVDDTPRTLNCGSLKILILIEYPYQLVVTLPHSFMTTVF